MADPTVDDRRTQEPSRLELLPPETYPSVVGGLIKDVWARIDDLWHGRAPLDAEYATAAP